MNVWLVRAGAHGEYEQKFIQEERVYVTWEALDVDLAELKEREDLASALAERYEDANPNTIRNWVSQVWRFAKDITVGDLVVVPLKTQRTIQIGQVVGDYQFEKDGPDPFFHWRAVKWVGESIPRDHFGQDLLYSFGAFLTICRIHRHNAVARIEAMMANGWKPESLASVVRSTRPDMESDDGPENSDLEAIADDQIARVISARFKGHNLSRLVDAILRAQGYTTRLSPEGADGGVDILAGAGPLGFGSPRLCVEVKSESTPIGRPAVDKLMGAIKKFQADQGLFVSWSGFRSNVSRELASSFFHVRLWSQKDLLEALFEVYDDLEEELKAELPLKQIWTVTPKSEG